MYNTTTNTTNFGLFATQHEYCSVNGYDPLKQCCLLGLVLIGVECIAARMYSLKFPESSGSVANLLKTVKHCLTAMIPVAKDLGLVLLSIAVYYHDHVFNTCRNLIPEYKFVVAAIVSGILFAKQTFVPIKIVWSNFQTVMIILVSFLTVFLPNIKTAVEVVMNSFGEENRSNITNKIDVANRKYLGFSDEDFGFVFWFVYLLCIDILIVCLCVSYKHVSGTEKPIKKHMNDKKKLKICFSYRSTDQKRVLQAKLGLEALGHIVFWGPDVSQMEKTGWRLQWCEQCRKADVCINFLSAAYVQSSSCVTEWNYAQKTGQHVLNVTLNGRHGHPQWSY